MSAMHIRSSTLRGGIVALALVGGGLLLVKHGYSPAKATPVPSPPAFAEVTAQKVQPARQEDAAKVRIVLSTTPAVFATVLWGGEQLGEIAPSEPLVLERQRDSGPVDLMIRATGFLPVQTRAHTSSDLALQVKLTRVEDVSGLLGYRAPLEVKEDAQDARALEEDRPVRRWFSRLFRR